jgi:hypothetical protein
MTAAINSESNDWALDHLIEIAKAEGTASASLAVGKLISWYASIGHEGCDELRIRWYVMNAIFNELSVCGRGTLGRMRLRKVVDEMLAEWECGPTIERDPDRGGE